MRRVGPLLLGLAFLPALGQAEEGAEAPRPFKLTVGHYAFSDDSHGDDVNLRHSSDMGNLWLGYFQLPAQHFSQWRSGWDTSWGSTWRVSPSIQIASQGFVGGSLQVETGETWFVGGGFGRTNLRPYWNLNFDPNDAWMASAGYRGTAGESYALQWVKDNRENPDQRHLHFVYRRPFADGRRLTVDVLHKDGLVDDVRIHRWGLGLTYDWPTFFIHVVSDPKTNFSSLNSTRIALGTRF